MTRERLCLSGVPLSDGSLATTTLEKSRPTS
jgi:hypothetical protein